MLAKKITTNTIIQFSAKVFGLALSLITVGLMTRYLGREGFGQYSTIIAYLGFFGILADFGLGLTLTQMISHLEGEKESKIFNNVFTLRLCSIILFLILGCLIAIFIPVYSLLIKLGIILTTLSFVFISLRDVIIPLFQKRLAMKRVALGEILGRLVLLCFVVLAIFLKLNLLAILGAVVLGSLANFLFVFISSQKLFLHPQKTFPNSTKEMNEFQKISSTNINTSQEGVGLIKFSFDFDLSLWKEILNRSWPMAFSIFFNLIYFRADILILSLFKSQEVVGIYGAPYKILEVLSMFPLIFVGLILPSLTKNWLEKNLNEFKKTLQGSFDFLVALTLPMVIGTLFLGRKIMVFVAGSEFGISGDVLKVLTLATGIIFVATLFRYVIVAIIKQKLMLWVYLIGAVVGLIGYLVFIPRYSYWGAAWTTVATEAIVGLGAFIICWQTIRTLPSLKFFWKSLFACLVMAGLLWVFREWGLGWLVLLAGGSYLGVLWLLGGIPGRILNFKIPVVLVNLLNFS